MAADRRLWFPLATPLADPRLRLFCFPYAGGGASIFHRWPQALPGGVEVCAAQLPGHETRIAEPPLSDLDALIGEIAGAVDPLLDVPFALFGHSMGALIAFELARRLRALGLRAPERLFVSARIAPQTPDESLQALRDGGDAALFAELERLDFTPKAVLDEPEMLELVLPILRADFRLCSSYVYRPEPPLDVPIVAFAGTHDRDAGAKKMREWEQQTSAGFAMRVIDGDHFFVTRRRETLLAELSRDLLK